MALFAMSGCASKPPGLPGSTTEGLASYYGKGFAGRQTANGEIFDPRDDTAAHRTYTFGTVLRVTNLANGRSVVVRVNDRGPYIAGRILDLSEGAARKIGMIEKGVARVRIEVLRRPAPKNKAR